MVTRVTIEGFLYQKGRNNQTLLFDIVQLCPTPLCTPPLFSSILSLTITGLCHSDLEFKHTSASHLVILTASITCLVNGSLKVLTTTLVQLCFSRNQKNYQYCHKIMIIFSLNWQQSSNLKLRNSAEVFSKCTSDFRYHKNHLESI